MIQYAQNIVLQISVVITVACIPCHRDDFWTCLNVKSMFRLLVSTFYIFKCDFNTKKQHKTYINEAKTRIHVLFRFCLKFLFADFHVPPNSSVQTVQKTTVMNKFIAIFVLFFLASVLAQASDGKLAECYSKCKAPSLSDQKKCFDEVEDECGKAGEDTGKINCDDAQCAYDAYGSESECEKGCDYLRCLSDCEPRDKDSYGGCDIDDPCTGAQATLAAAALALF